jgi:hypothetical protein
LTGGGYLTLTKKQGDPLTLNKIKQKAGVSKLPTLHDNEWINLYEEVRKLFIFKKIDNKPQEYENLLCYHYGNNS